MSNIPAPMNGTSTANDRRDVLREIGAKWSKFTPQELAALETNDDLVGQLVDKYGVEKEAAQRDVDALMGGRNLTA